jgi:hypothetical protein
MVRFEENKLVIEVQSHSQKDAVEKWITLQRELLFLMRWLENDKISKDFYTIPDLLDELLPDWEQAKKMAE